MVTVRLYQSLPGASCHSIVRRLSGAQMPPPISGWKLPATVAMHWFMLSATRLGPGWKYQRTSLPSAASDTLLPGKPMLVLSNAKTLYS